MNNTSVFKKYNIQFLILDHGSWLFLYIFSDYLYSHVLRKNNIKYVEDERNTQNINNLKNVVGRSLPLRYSITVDENYV
jgi:hypothetical protein